MAATAVTAAAASRPIERLAFTVLLVAAAALLGGCTAIRTSAIKGVASTLSGGGGTAAAHDDPELIAAALPFALMLHESLLASVPNFAPLLATTCSLYTQYAFGFVAADAEAVRRDDFERSRQLDARAFRLVERGRAYCWRGLETRFRGITQSLSTDPVRALARTTPKDVELLYWSAASLGAAISVGGLDHPERLIDWPLVRALAERALALNETWNNGAIPELLITVDSQGETLGGSEARARRHFARAVEIQRGLSPSPYVALAMGVAKSRQDRDEFLRLLQQALAIDPEKDPRHRLMTLLTQQRAKVLLERVDELFLEGAVYPQ